MSQAKIEEAIKMKKLLCPECKQPITEFSDYKQSVGSVWDGAGDSNLEMEGCTVTLKCGSCSWKENTEFWDAYLDE